MSEQRYGKAQPQDLFVSLAQRMHSIKNKALEAAFKCCFHVPSAPFTNSNLILLHVRKVAAAQSDEQVQISTHRSSRTNGRLKNEPDRFDFCEWMSKSPYRTEWQMPLGRDASFVLCDLRLYFGTFGLLLLKYWWDVWTEILFVRDSRYRVVRIARYRLSL